MTIGPLSAIAVGCFATGEPDNFDIAATQYLISTKISSLHYVEVYVDGYVWSPAEVWPKAGNQDASFYVDVPNDGVAHQIQVVDTGRYGTPAAASTPLSVTSDCIGAVKAEVVETVEDPDTHVTYVTVKVTHDGKTQGTHISRVTVDGKTAGPEIVLKEGDYEPRTATIPADGGKHLIKVEIQHQGVWMKLPLLWRVVQAPLLGDAPPLPTSVETNQFFPGETVILQGTEESRLDTHVSDFAYVLLSPRDTEGLWRTVGPNNGLIRPNSDGYWEAHIETDPVNFPAGSEWAIFLGRLRRQRGSPYGLVYNFSMIAGPAPAPPTMAAPRIDGPLNHNQRSSTWMELFGTGLPGASLTFEVTAVTEWGKATDVPIKTTVAKDGTWRTQVYSTQPAKPHPYKILRYRVKARANGQESPWSAPLDVTWYYPTR